MLKICVRPVQPEVESVNIGTKNTKRKLKETSEQSKLYFYIHSSTFFLFSGFFTLFTVAQHIANYTLPSLVILILPVD